MTFLGHTASPAYSSSISACSNDNCKRHCGSSARNVNLARVERTVFEITDLGRRPERSAGSSRGCGSAARPGRRRLLGCVWPARLLLVLSRRWIGLPDCLRRRLERRLLRDRRSARVKNPVGSIVKGRRVPFSAASSGSATKDAPLPSISRPNSPSFAAARRYGATNTAATLQDRLRDAAGGWNVISRHEVSKPSRRRHSSRALRSSADMTTTEWRSGSR